MITIERASEIVKRLADSELETDRFDAVQLYDHFVEVLRPKHLGVEEGDKPLWSEMFAELCGFVKVSEEFTTNDDIAE